MVVFVRTEFGVTPGWAWAVLDRVDALVVVVVGVRACVRVFVG